MYSYWLGGSHYLPTDRDRAERALACVPHLPYLVRTHRAFLRRAVRYLVGLGVAQFLDLGSGLPADGSVHEVAQGVNPDCRVVYTDLDAAVATEGRRLLADVPGTGYVHADIRDPERLLGAVAECGLLDLGRPTAVVMVDVLQHIPDEDDPAGLIAAYAAAVGPAGYLAISHTSPDPDTLAGLELYAQLYAPSPAMTFRHPMRVVELLGGLEIVAPGVVPVPLWRPEPGADTDRNPEHFFGCAALARPR
ncbi:hypothetical protein GTS_00140 [Gandjariella thermophila]|uniref:S-adenosyl methyltransferase n=2 Tax=Gandjariella thermophila TaxID=1931992 RepID=A0A4D4IW17_9PSEU|nr:hypothetical protein GTS_00140 [Gandjariella thermophila]